LAPEGKVICIRLSLFAEMMKGKSWLPVTLKEVGGTEGVGATFLEDTFSATTAPPEHRYHQKAARAVLKALLPEAGTDIRGHMRSQHELLEASGYAGRPREFQQLFSILDSEIRLITPTDPEGAESADRGRQRHDTKPDEGTDAPRSPEKYYQLTHDYLVHSLRDWLTHKQRETRRGRAELLLADLAAFWSARPENRQLPSLPEWLQIRWLTARKNWTPPQRTMMRRAALWHAVRGIVVLLLISPLAALGVRTLMIQQSSAGRAAELVQRLLTADIAAVPGIVEEIEAYRPLANPLLREADANAPIESSLKLKASLALLPVDATQVTYLHGRLLDADPREVGVLRDSLFPYRKVLLDSLWAVAERPDKDREHQRLRAASALAEFDPESSRWAEVQVHIGNDLLAEPALNLATWMDYLQPIRAKLLDHLSRVYRDSRPVTEVRSAEILGAYAADQPERLADLLMAGDEIQFAALYPKLADPRDLVLTIFVAELDKHAPLDAMEDAKEKLAKRQANAAAALLRKHRADKVWPLLRHSEDPRVRSYVIHRLKPSGVNAKVVLNWLERESDVTVRRALLLSSNSKKGPVPGIRG
jgi:hypothetical protein